MSKSDFSLLAGEKYTEEFAHFELDMGDKLYGPEETAQAFSWFKAGWAAFRDSRDWNER